MGLKAAVRSWINRLGYDLRRLPPGGFPFPEATGDEREIVRTCQPFTMTGLESLWSTVVAARYVIRNEIPGAVVECGVWRGGQMMTVALSALLEERNGLVRPNGLPDLWLFDTFTGMARPGERDRHGDMLALDEYRKHDRSDHVDWCYASLEDVKANLVTTRYPLDKLRFVKGRVEETLRQPDLPERISLLRLDTDWYESTKLELEVLYPRLSPGGVLVIDDYGYWEGARAATDEYFAAMRAPPLLHAIDETARILVKR